MTITKLPSGNYRIRYYDASHKQKSITIDHEPSKREAKQLIDDAKADESTFALSNDSFEAIANEYIQAKYNVLSPNTRRGYKICLSRLSEAFRRASVNSIDKLTIQREINGLSAKYAAKTVRNTHGFISAIMDMYRPNLHIKTKLPMDTRTDYYCPTNDDIKKIMDAAKGTRYYVPFALGILGMRRGEIVAALPSDLTDNKLSINKSIYVDENRQHGVKAPKTTTSIREIYIPDEVADMIRQQGFVCDVCDNMLYKALKRFQKDLGIHSFRFHDLRVYYASYAHAMGVPDKYIQEGGGWKTDNTMKKIYRKAMEEEYKKTQTEYLDKIKNIL